MNVCTVTSSWHKASTTRPSLSSRSPLQAHLATTSHKWREAKQILPRCMCEPPLSVTATNRLLTLPCLLVPLQRPRRRQLMTFPVPLTPYLDNAVSCISKADQGLTGAGPAWLLHLCIVALIWSYNSIDTARLSHRVVAHLHGRTLHRGGRQTSCLCCRVPSALARPGKWSSTVLSWVGRCAGPQQSPTTAPVAGTGP